MIYIEEVDENLYPEWVVRSSLYWMSEVTTWKLNKKGNIYQIELTKPTEENICRLHRLLNDFSLRSNLLEKTANLRYEIIKKSLLSIEGGKL